jgi:multimeric flavodoxin WrbA
MKVVGFVGSPRKKGNTAALVKEVMRGAQDGGAETKIYYLNEMNIRGCQGCRACKKKPEGVCIQKDDMAFLYDEIRNSDAVVVGTPVYMFQMTGQTKLFVDRLYAFLNTDFTHKLGQGKKTLMVYAQGQTDAGIFQSSFDVNKMVFSFLGFSVQDTIVAAGTAPDDVDVLKNKEFMEKAYNAGKAVIAS